MLPEVDSYGLRKRFKFVAACVARRRPGWVLNVGCGAGTYLTQPLAEKIPETTLCAMRSLFESVGFEVSQFRPGTFLCGFIFDQVLRRESWLRWNERVSERLWPFLVIAWMFELVCCEPKAGFIMRLGWYAKLRPALNRRRVGL